MNDLLTQAFGAQLSDGAAALRAAVVLLIFPVYYFVLATLGLYLFYRSRRLRIEQRQHIDLLIDEFPALQKSLSVGQRAAASKVVPAPVRQDETAEEIAEVASTAHEPKAVVGRPGQTERQIGNDKSREGMWEIAVHDAPLLILSAMMICSAFVAIALLEPFTSGDPLTRLIQSRFFGVPEGGLLSPLTRGATGFLLPMLGYTLIGFLVMAWMPGRLFRFFGLEWLHLEPLSRRSRWVRSLWRKLCFVNFNRLDGTTGKWLVFIVPIYVVTLAGADFLALMYSFPLPPALLAAAHLFPLVLPSMFAQVWSTPIQFTRQPCRGGEKIAIEALPDHLAGREYLGGLVEPPVARSTQTVVLSASNPIRHDEGKLPPRLEHALEVEGREELAPFVVHAVHELIERKSSLVVSGPKGSGRSVVMRMSLVEAAFRGRTSLVLVQTAEDARRLMRELKTFAAGYPAVEFFHVEYAGANTPFAVRKLADGIDVLIVDMQSIDRTLARHDFLSVFFRRLGLVAVLGFDEVSPLVKAELPYVIARVTLVADLESPSLPVLVSVLDGARADPISFTKLLSRQFKELPLGHMAASTIHLLTLAPIGKSSISVERDLALLTRFGQGLADAGYRRFFLSTGSHTQGALEKLDQAGWTTRVDDLMGEESIVSLVRLRPEKLFSQLSEIRELSRISGHGVHICFLLAPIDGFDEWIHAHLHELLAYRQDHLSPVLLPGNCNSALQRKHVLRALLDQPLTAETLATFFGHDALRAVQAAAGSPGQPLPPHGVVVEEDPIEGPTYRYYPDAEVPTPRTRTAEGVIDPVDESTSVLVRCKDLGVSRYIDGTRQNTLLWPGRVFDLEGQRVRVVGPPQAGVLECEPEEDDVRTLPIRQLFVAENRDIRMASDHVFGAEGIGVYRADLEVESLIVGYRVWKGRDLVRESLYGPGDQVSSRFVADAAVVFFPGLDPESAHLIAHVIKRYLKLIVGDTDDVLDVTHNCFEPFSKGVSANVYHDVTIVDNVPGGTAVCDLVTPTLIRKIAALVVTMDSEGIPWSRIQECYYPRLGRFDAVMPDAAPDADAPVAQRLVEYFQQLILVEDCAETDSLDYTCNLWRDESAPKKSAAVAAAQLQPVAASPEIELSVPLRELLAKVYAQANRIGRPGGSPAED